MSLSVRRAMEQDLPALVRLHQAVHDLHVAARPEHFTALTDAAAEQRFREFFEDASSTVWVAEAAGTVHGYLVAILQRRPATVYSYERRWCDLDQISVAASARRRGVARALIATAVGAARAQGIAQVELSSWAFNQTAQAAFRNLGFVPKTTRFELPLEADPGAATSQTKG